MEIKQMKQCFLSQKGPRAIGPYSTATIHGGACYLSGMLPVIPETGKLAEGGAAAQARQVFENMKAVLSELNCSMEDILKTTVFLQDLGPSEPSTRSTPNTSGPTTPRAAASRWRSSRWAR